MAADMEVHMVADMEVDKVADMVAGMAADKKNGRNGVGHSNMEINLVRGLVTGLVNWAQTLLTRSLPDLRVF